MKPNFPASWLLLAALVAAPLAGCETPLPYPDAEDVTFALMGDTPYNDAEVRSLDALIDDINGQDLAFVVHVGDITSGRGQCTDAWFEARRRQFNRIRHPFVLIPGDNDWVDCHRSGFDPMERLDKMRRLFHSGDASIGQRTIRLDRQSSNPRFAEYREHVRWVAADVVFVGLNVQGSNNNLGRTPAMDEEHRRRMVAVLAWLDESMTLAAQRRLAGAVICIQANPDFEGRYRRRPGVGDGFEAFREALRAHALRAGKRSCSSRRHPPVNRTASTTLQPASRAGTLSRGGPRLAAGPLGSRPGSAASTAAYCHHARAACDRPSRLNFTITATITHVGCLAVGTAEASNIRAG
jgi:hypothetical protein